MISSRPKVHGIPKRNETMKTPNNSSVLQFDNAASTALHFAPVSCLRRAQPKTLGRNNSELGRYLISKPKFASKFQKQPLSLSWDNPSCPLYPSTLNVVVFEVSVGTFKLDPTSSLDAPTNRGCDCCFPPCLLHGNKYFLLASYVDIYFSIRFMLT